MEYHNSHLYFTVGSTRYQLDQQSGGSSVAGNYGNIQINRNGTITSPGSDSLNFNAGLSVKGTITSSALTSGRIPYLSTGGLLVDNANLKFDGYIFLAGGATYDGYDNVGYGGNGVNFSGRIKQDNSNNYLNY